MAAATIALIAIIYLLLWLPPVQRKIVDAALATLMNRTHNHLSVGQIHFRPFNRLELRDLYAADLQGDTLLFANRLAASFDLFALLNNRLLIRSAELDGFVLNAVKDSPQADFNFQFLINAFASSSSDSSSTEIQIRNIRLNNGRASYTLRSAPTTADSLLDFNHIQLKQIYSELSLSSSPNAPIDLRLHSLSFAERSGLSLKQLEGRLQINNGSFLASNLSLQLPHSQLKATGNYAPSGDYHLQWQADSIHLPDLQSLAPILSLFPEKLMIEGEAMGQLPRIDLPRLLLNYGETLHLDLQASLADYLHWDNSPLHLLLNPSFVHASLLAQYLPQPPDANTPPRPLFPEGKYALNGRVEGALPHLSLHLEAEGDAGHLLLQGQGGYLVPQKTAHFDASLHAADLALNLLLNNSSLGRADASFNIEGRLTPSGKLEGKALAHIDALDYNAYSYNNINAEAIYRADTLLLTASSIDPNLPFSLSAAANIGPKTPALSLDARLQPANLTALHLLPAYPSASLAGRLRASIQGFQPEAMRGELKLDSLQLKTNRGTFSEPHFRLLCEANNADKTLQINSRIAKLQARGSFTYAGLHESMEAHFPIIFPQKKKKKAKAKPEPAPASVDFRVGMNHVAELADLLDLPRQLPDSALIIGKYTSQDQDMRLSASAYTRFMETDTLQLSLSLSGIDNGLSAIFNVDNKSSSYDFDGSLDAQIAFLPLQNGFPAMDIHFNPSIWILNETLFDFHPSAMEIRPGRYALHNLLLAHSDDPGEYFRINGAASAGPADSLLVEISQFRLATLFGAVKADLPLSGIVDGRLSAHRLLSSPSAWIEDFMICELAFDDHPVGDLQLMGSWNRERDGLAFDAALGLPGSPPSTLSGWAIPASDQLEAHANIRDVALQWFQGRVGDSLFGLSGSIGATLQVSGTLSDPQVTGLLRADSARVGVRMLNTLYIINDTLAIRPDAIELNDFIIRDENNHALTAAGRISHTRFSHFTPNINLTLNDFLVLNNERQVDSLFFGNLRVNGLLTVRPSAGDWLIAGDITHSNHARLTVNLPASASTAERYDRMIVYVSPEQETASAPVQRPRPAPIEQESSHLPLKINASLWFDPSLTMGAVFNPLTGDAAHVTGNGRIRFSYDMKTENLSLLGDYDIVSGSAGISLANIARKTFVVEEGGKLVFHGDPMATTFNLTAHYNLRADLRTLDPSFGNLGIANTKAPVSCALTAVGSINRMTLEYDILLPTEPEDVQRKVDGLLYTDDMKIKQIAYLVALGSFMPASSDSPSLGSPNIVNSLTALTSGGLNKLLSSVLSDKWSIGTDVNGLDNISINVSGSLLNDRLTVNGQVGYHGNTGLTNNFTGDFNVEYQLLPSGNLVLKAYNATNNQYYEQAPTTQGVGVAYKREARTFRKLFDRFKKKK
jgi:hypothetical protein